MKGIEKEAFLKLIGLESPTKEKETISDLDEKI